MFMVLSSWQSQCESSSSSHALISFSLPLDAIRKRGLCRHAVSVRPSIRLYVCLSRSYVLSKRINISFTFFSPSGSHIILVFPYQTGWRYSDGNPPNGVVECKWVGRNRDSEPISGFTACCQRCNRPGVVNTAGGGPRLTSRKL